MIIDSDYTMSLLSKVSESFKTNFESRDSAFYPFHKNHFRFLDESSGKFTEPFVSTGLKNELPKLNIETGQSVNVSLNDVKLSANSIDSDLRVISYTTAKKLGLELKNEADIQKKLANAFSFPDISDIDFREPPFNPDNFINVENSYKPNFFDPINVTQCGYFKATLNHGFLISLDEIKDQDFVNAIDSAAKARMPKLSFDDAKYEPIFNKLEQYIEQLPINVVHTYSHDYDNDVEEALLKDKKSILVNYYPCYDLTNSSSGDCFLPAPVLFKSENDYIRAASHLVTNTLIENSDLNVKDIAPEYLNLIKDLSGSMFAEYIGVPIDQEEIKRLSANTKAVKMFLDGNEVQVFELAAKYANQAINLEINKFPAQYKLWSNFKNNLETVAKTMASPSLDELCKQYNVEMTRDNVIKALNGMTNQKVNEVGQSKDSMKSALSQDKPITNNLLEKLRFALSANKTKEPQSKGIER